MVKHGGNLTIRDEVRRVIRVVYWWQGPHGGMINGAKYWLCEMLFENTDSVNDIVESTVWWTESSGFVWYRGQTLIVSLDYLKHHCWIIYYIQYM